MGRNPFLDLLAALLPASERDGLIRRHGADPFVCSFLLGLLEFFLGGKALLSNALSSYQELTSAIATHVVEHLDPRQLNSFEAKLAVTESGAVVWLTWAVRPATWLLASVPLVGIVRLVAFGVSRDAVGEPLVWLALRMAQAMRRLRRPLRTRLRFGPLRPDRVLRDSECDMAVLSCRPKPDWNELVTVEIGERFYRLQRVEERRDGSWRAHAYLLDEADPNEVIRGLVRYERPGPSSPLRPSSP